MSTNQLHSPLPNKVASGGENPLDASDLPPIVSRSDDTSLEPITSHPKADCIPDSAPSSSLSSVSSNDAPMPSGKTTVLLASSESVCKFSICKGGVMVPNNDGLIVEETLDIIEHRYVPVSAYRSGRVSIQDIISHVHTTNRDGPCALWEQVCPDCKQDPCILFDHASHIQEIGVFLHKKGKTNRQVRFELYCRMVKIIHGNLGHGDHRELPYCVIQCIRTAFSNAIGDPYIGFSEY